MKAALLSALALPLLVAAAPAPVTPAELSATVQEIASDPYQGRAPGTPGEAKTIAYLVGRLKALGLKPAGPGGQWTQAVPMIHDVAGKPSSLALTVGGTDLAPVVGTDIAPGTTRATDRVQIADAPLVFVGYGVSAPERGWDDFKGVDLHGKIAVFLVNDPDFEAQPGDGAYGKFGGKAMTYYGRWTYKYEEAARRGAIGALIVHEDGPAGYGWNVAGNSVGGTYALPAAAGHPQPVAMQSWIARPFAEKLFRAAGLDLATLKQQARQADFHPIALKGAALSIDMPVKSDRIESHNVLAQIPGTEHPQETVMFGAHWDAYGVGAADAQGRTIRPGANDDGLGVAGVLALAKAFKAGPAPQRTLVFGLWTAEERGLLGSEYYAQNPVFPVAKTVGVLTIDILQTAGPARDVVLIGAGQDSLDHDLADVAQGQGRTITPDSKPERGLFYRADHFSLAKRGVPTLLMMGAGGGADLVAGGRAAGDKWVTDYTAHCYHQTCDTWSADWDLRGAAQDVNLLYALGRRLAWSREWPSWNADSEFKALREKTAAERR
ncbi:M28 family metallopeptidase [Sphingomonas abietis]|uniref:M20/M25/M40 family metallo-hydrolase n=1 Tax=Sphingomonas abietis TaxID=3012344 RepID=A0ABY7NMH0_9SPHN|nr:M28 family peptidase [Sphingomonas abietis]WBO22548.1 M20/M25/M40 family metallo-hydrolase [Sphingomonas abietis]